MLKSDEELHVRLHGEFNYLVVEFSVPWYDFLLRFVITVEGGMVLANRVHGPAHRQRIYKQVIEHPTAIEDLLDTIQSEWDRYLGRSKPQ